MIPVNPYPFTIEDKQWVLRPDDTVVAQICFDYRVTLTVGNATSIYFSVELASRFSFMNAGAIHTVDVEADPMSGSALLALRLRPVHEIAIAPEDGVLHLLFAGDASIVVEANSQYEAWQFGFFEAGQELRVVCTPGGELAVWSPVDREGEQ